MRSRVRTGRGRTTRRHAALVSRDGRDDLAPGTAVDRFTITRALGRGAMGVVYAAYDPELDRRIALKVLAEHLEAPDAETDAESDAEIGSGASSRGEARRLRLLREAQSMASLTHPNVVRVHGVGLHERHVYIAMEFVDGVSLREWLNVERRKWHQLLPVFIDAAQGLAAAHAAGLVHRDFKPDNVMVTAAGQAKVGDFGLARATDQLDAGADGAVSRARDVARRSGLSSGRALEADLTRTGAAVGTPAYMSPEQHAALPLDARSDQFSFFVALYEALVGRRPFERRTVQEVARAKAEGKVAPPPSSSRVPASLFDIVERGLAASPDARHPDMSTVAARLRVELERVPARRRALRRAGLGLGVVALGSLGLWAGLRRSMSAGCDELGAPLAATWNDQARARLSERVSGARLPFAREEARRLAEAVDRYAAGWSRARLDACVEVRQTHARAEAWLDERMVCLERREAELDAFLDLVARVPDERLGVLIARVDDLTPAAACLRNADVDERPVPDDPDLAARVATLREEMTEVRGQRRFGVRGPALSHARAVADEARTLDYDPIIAESLALLATVQPRSDEGAIRRVALNHQAAQAALRSGHRVALAEAWIGLVDALTRRGQLDDARRWFEYARRQVRRVEDPELEADLAGVGVWLSIMVDDVAQANEHARRELEIVERVFGPQHARAIPALNHVGVAAYYDHRKDEALDYYRRALEVGETRHGPRSPEVSPMLNNIGVVLTDQGRYAEAVTYYQRSLEIRRAGMSEDDPSLLQAYDNLAEALVRAESWRSAVPRCEKVLALIERGAGPIDAGELDARLRLVTALRGVGRLDDARARLDETAARLEALEDVGPRQQRWRGRLEIERTRVELAAGDRRAARRSAAAAREAFRRGKAPQGRIDEVDALFTHR